MLLASKACRRALTRSFVRQETVRTKFSLASMFGRSKQKKTFTLSFPPLLTPLPYTTPLSFFPLSL